MLLALQPFLRLALTGLVVAVSPGVAMAQPLLASTTLFAVLLITAKLVADVVSHLHERERLSPRVERGPLPAPI